jgi:tellurite methyltransferase
MSTPKKPSFTEQVTAQYDSWYRDHDEVFGEPLPLVKQIAKQLPAGRVLDVGGGEGKNALYLARQGFSVTVVDLSEVGLSKVQAVAEAEALAVRVVVGDVTKQNFSDTFNVVLFSFVLHHLSTETALKTMKHLQQLTDSGGVHAIATMANQGELYERASKSGRFYPSQTELKDLYRGWKILFIKQAETTSFAKRKDGVRMKNDRVTALFQKP